MSYIGDDSAALNNLSCLLKLNKRHYGAYCSKSSLLAKSGDLSSAVYNLTHAISLRPNMAELYFVRAELYEKVGVAWMDDNNSRRYPRC